jgi:hypothetical protein
MNPMSKAHLAVIRLESAGTAERPRNADRRFYEITAPVDAAGRLDGRDWSALRDACAVRRVDATAEIARRLVCHPNGDWQDDAGEIRFLGRTFRPGASVAVREADGATRSYRVTSLRALTS